MRIDAHQHFWRPSRGDYGWLTPEAHPAICREFLPRRPGAAARGRRHRAHRAGAGRADRRPRPSILLGLAAETPFVAGVVGWADFEAPDAAARIAALAQNASAASACARCCRTWPTTPGSSARRVAPALDAMQAAGLRFDALVTPRHLPHLARFLAAPAGACRW